MRSRCAVRELLCETSVELPRVAIPHHPSAMSTTTTEPSANNLATIWFRSSLWVVAWKLGLSSCVALTPRRETQGDESSMNQRMTHSIRGLFTGVRGSMEFSEVRAALWRLAS